jgi:hypothetical protein
MQGHRRLASDSNFEQGAAMRKLKMEKLKPKASKKAKTVLVALQSETKLVQCPSVTMTRKRIFHAVSVI